MYRQFLKTYVSRSEQLVLNSGSPEGKRWCNFLCQKYQPTESFYAKQAGRNMCKECSRTLALVRKYVKSERITKDQFRENPNILEEYTQKQTTDKKLECVVCKITKNMCYFDSNRNTCKKCRVKQNKERIQKSIHEDIKKIEDYKNNEKTLRQFIQRLPVNEIFAILKHYGLTRKSTDKKGDVVFKLIEYFRKLQDPYKCLGNCGFSLQEEFSYCGTCKDNPRMSVDEKNHLFKENLPTFMEGLNELTEEDMHAHNTFCINAIAEYLGITLFKTKKKGNTKAKMVEIINKTLRERKEKENPTLTEQKPPELELNGIVIQCREDGYINATKLCKAGGKRFKHWNSLESTKELVNALFLKVGIPTFRLIDSTKGRYGGSWIHPDLAIQLAQWISPVFALQVSGWVREIALTGSVVLRHEKNTEELLRIQKEYSCLERKHNNLLERRQYYKFKKGSVFYIISDTESKCVKYKPGFEGVDVNVRLAQHRSTSPSIRVEMLIYSGISECRLLEASILQRYSGKRRHNNHEWVYDVEVGHIIGSVTTLLDFLGIEYTEEGNLGKYNGSL